MGTTVDFIKYVCDQIAGAGEIHYRKMFGEYMVYVNDKPLLMMISLAVFCQTKPLVR